ncbi:MAG: glutathione peroxidase [Ilumatobacteraceae bacterium]
MSVYDNSIGKLSGSGNVLDEVKGKVTMVVNVASKCGLTPQYEAMQKLHTELSSRGFSVLGIPCNQFAGQEPGGADEIQSFCSLNYNVTFPISEKVEVNGDHRHPLYTELTKVADSEGHSGDIRWNFEKFLIGRDGSVIARFNPTVVPDSPEVLAAIEMALK